MNTAVQLRADGDDTPRCDLLHGVPSSMATGKVGPVALFPSGEIVAYRIRQRRRTRVLVFRTLEVDDRLALHGPPARPGRSQLLVEIRHHDTSNISRKRARASDSVDFTVPSETPITAAVSAIVRST